MSFRPQQFVPSFQGATASAPGTRGLVPQPAIGQQGRVLCGDGTWKDLTGDIDAAVTAAETAQAAAEAAAASMDSNSGSARIHSGTMYVKVDNETDAAHPWHRVHFAWALGTIQLIVEEEGIAI